MSDVRSIKATIDEKGAAAPYLITIGERANNIRQDFDERNLTSEEARQQLELLAEEALAAERAREESGLDDDTFPIYWEMKRHSYKDPKKLALALADPFRRFPDFNSNADELRQLKAELYRLLLPVVQGKQMVEVAERLLKLRSK